MPLTKSGTKILKSMRKQYGKKKGKSVFYASMSKRKKGTSKWHQKSNKHYFLAWKNLYFIYLFLYGFLRIMNINGKILYTIDLTGRYKKELPKKAIDSGQ